METDSPLAAFYCCSGILVIAAIGGMSSGIGYCAFWWLNRNWGKRSRHGCAAVAIAMILFVVLLIVLWEAVKNTPMF